MTKTVHKTLLGGGAGKGVEGVGVVRVSRLNRCFVHISNCRLYNTQKSYNIFVTIEQPT